MKHVKESCVESSTQISEKTTTTGDGKQKSDEEVFYGPTTRKAWSEWCSQRYQKNNMKDEPKKKSTKSENNDKYKHDDKMSKISNTTKTSSDSTSKKMTAKKESTKQPRPRKDSKSSKSLHKKLRKTINLECLDLLHKETVVSISNSTNRIAVAPGCVESKLNLRREKPLFDDDDDDTENDEEIKIPIINYDDDDDKDTIIDKDEETEHETDVNEEIITSKKEKPLKLENALEDLMERMFCQLKQQYLSFIAHMRTQTYRESLVKMVQDEKSRNVSLISRISLLEQTVKSLIERGVYLLKARLAELDIVANNSDELVNKAREIVIRNKELQEQVSAFTEQVNYLNSVNAYLKQQQIIFQQQQQSLRGKSTKESMKSRTNSRSKAAAVVARTSPAVTPSPIHSPPIVAKSPVIVAAPLSQPSPVTSPILQSMANLEAVELMAKNESMEKARALAACQRLTLSAKKADSNELKTAEVNIVKTSLQEAENGEKTVITMSGKNDYLINIEERMKRVIVAALNEKSKNETVGEKDEPENESGKIKEKRKTSQRLTKQSRVNGDECSLPDQQRNLVNSNSSSVNLADLSRKNSALDNNGNTGLLSSSSLDVRPSDKETVGGTYSTSPDKEPLLLKIKIDRRDNSASVSAPSLSNIDRTPPAEQHSTKRKKHDYSPERSTKSKSKSPKYGSAVVIESGTEPERRPSLIIKLSNPNSTASPAQNSTIIEESGKSEVSTRTKQTSNSTNGNNKWQTAINNSFERLVKLAHQFDPTKNRSDERPADYTSPIQMPQSTPSPVTFPPLIIEKSATKGKKRKTTRLTVPQTTAAVVDTIKMINRVEATVAAATPVVSHYSNHPKPVADTPPHTPSTSDSPERPITPQTPPGMSTVSDSSSSQLSVPPMPLKSSTPIINQCSSAGTTVNELIHEDLMRAINERDFPPPKRRSGRPPKKRAANDWLDSMAPPTPGGMSGLAMRSQCYDYQQPGPPAPSASQVQHQPPVPQPINGGPMQAVMSGHMGYGSMPIQPPNHALNYNTNTMSSMNTLQQMNTVNTMAPMSQMGPMNPSLMNANSTSTHAMSSMNSINSMNVMNQMSPMSSMNSMASMNQMNQMATINSMNQMQSVGQVNAMNQVNPMGAMQQQAAMNQSYQGYANMRSAMQMPPAGHTHGHGMMNKMARNMGNMGKMAATAFQNFNANYEPQNYPPSIYNNGV